jgi:hypothetical protein
MYDVRCTMVDLDNTIVHRPSYIEHPLCPREELNLYLGLRSPPFYPLNYEGGRNKQNGNIRAVQVIVSYFPPKINCFVCFLILPINPYYSKLMMGQMKDEKAKMKNISGIRFARSFILALSYFIVGTNCHFS